MDELRTWAEWYDDYITYWENTLSMLKEYAPEGVIPKKWSEVVENIQWESEQGDVEDWPDDEDWDKFAGDLADAVRELFEDAFNRWHVDPDFVSEFWDEDTSTNDS